MNTSSAALLQVSGLRHRYASRVALESFDFSVNPGEFVALLGPNGSGKSTALMALVGLLRPEAGHVIFDGQAMEPGARELRRHTAVVFQTQSADGRLSARENLLLYANVYGVPAAERERRVDEALSHARLQDRAGDDVRTLSGGMRRRLELARVLLMRPKLLVLDEPTTGLDEVSFRNFWEEVEVMRKRDGLSVLVATHRADEAERCDRAILISEGRVVGSGTPDELRAEISGDVIELEVQDAEAFAVRLNAELGLSSTLLAGRLALEVQSGHEWIPRIVALAPALIRSVNMRRPSLADVFVKRTGKTLATESLVSAPATKRGMK